MMNLSKIPSHQMSDLSFSTYTPEEIRKMSVLEVTNPRSFDILGHPIKNGVYDSRFGPLELREACATCGCPSSSCVGHFGHIVLPMPVFNPFFIRIILKLLKGSCLKCRCLRASQSISCLVLYQLRALDHGLITLAKDMDFMAKKFISTCSDTESTASVLQLTENLTSMLNAKLEEMGESIVPLKEISSTSMVKSVIEHRNQIVSEYLNKHINRDDCRKCKDSRRSMHVEYNARIVIGAAVTRKKALQIAKKNLKMRKKRQKDDENEEFVQGGSGRGEEEEEESVLEDTVSEVLSVNQAFFTQEQARNHLRKVYESDGAILKQLFGSLAKSEDSSDRCPMDGLFLEVLPVPPIRFRPVTFVAGNKYDNPHSVVLSSVVLDCIVMRHLLAAIKNDQHKFSDEITALVSKLIGANLLEKLHSAWYALQVRINTVFDSDMDRLNRDTIGGVRQLLEKKSGLFRMHMMGKRVNHAARSVISPDPYINVDEIGVPDIFAKKLTYPQPVTSWNIKVLRQAVINGPDVHPGASMVQNEDGSIVMLSRNRVQREAVAKQLLTPSLDSALRGCKTVYRHLQNGDVLLLNRQPTLHKPSIMAHKACVLPGEKTLRLNYSNCKTYNADFDGDEMNAHFPQSELARAEAYSIACVSHQYLVPKDGTPLGGLIQDHIIAAVLLMIRGKFFNREDYQQLVFGALTNKNDRVIVLRPSILRPCARWSGKQVVSTVLINTIPSGQHLLSLNGKSKIPPKSWQNSERRQWLAGGTQLNEMQMSESEVIIRNGEILCGTLDKAHCGPTSYGLIHSCYELYGGEVSGLLLSRLGRLFTHFLQMEGFTLGVHDILVKPKADRKRSRLMKKAAHLGDAVVREALRLPEDVDDVTLRESMMVAHLGRDNRSMKELDLSMKIRTDELNNEINKACMPEGLVKSFPDNNLQLMVISGAKGSSVNCMQISGLLGQIELEGHRPPLMLSGRTLPAFLPYDSSPRAGGFVDGRFLTGIRPQEYFFHCMAGREGLIDTAVKTSRSGYLQRCLIKLLEGVAVGYDLTVRDSDGSVIQFQYGEDALDVTKTPFLHGQQFPFLVENAKCILHNDEVEVLKERTDYKTLLKTNKRIRKWKRRAKRVEQGNGTGWKPNHSQSAAFLNFASEQKSTNAKSDIVKLWFELSPEQRQSYEWQNKCPDPVTSEHRPDLALGAISERLDDIIESYLRTMPQISKANRLSSEEIRTMLHQKVLRSVCEPGEAVGLLAAQSVGEPSTQMTLNTFHFAGRGEMNVTLGIPRLREILMTASKTIATPSLEVPFLPGVKRLNKMAELLKQKLTRVYLSDVLNKVSITERIVIQPRDRTRTYIIRFDLLPFKRYRRDLYVTPSKILLFLETIFFQYLLMMIGKKGRLLQMSTLVSNVTMRESTGAKLGSKTKDNDDDDGDDGDVANKFDGGDDKGAQDDGGAAGDVSSDDGEGDEADAAGQKNRARHNQELDLEELDEDERKLQKQEAGESEDEGFGEPELNSKVVDGSDDHITEVKAKYEENYDKEQEEEEEEGLMGENSEDVNVCKLKLSEEDLENRAKNARKRIQAVKFLHNSIADYTYDIENEEWCEITIKLNISDKRLDMTTLIEEEAKKAIVHHTSGIKKAFIVDDTDSEGNARKLLKTEGVNIQEIVKYHDLLDLNKLYSNDVHAIAQTYGIEAAFRIIVKEIQNVFRVYGIEVDPRHLLLIADFMTFEGVYRPFSRTGMESSASPLQQMSFETTMHFLRQATIHGLPDTLKSPSSKLVVGQLVTCGTGSFALMQPLTL